MAYIVINVDLITPDTDTTMIVAYHWQSISGPNNASGNGELTMSSSLLASVLNQNVINQCLSESSSAGITVGVLERKIIASGIL